MKKILVLGGGAFLGYAVAKVLELNNFDITFFNTGKNTPKLFPNLQTKIGNRQSHRSKKIFHESIFDAVVDTCAYNPLDLTLTRHLNYSQYILISSVAVYSKKIPFDSNEDAEKIFMNKEFKKDKVYNYGELKYLTEIELQKISSNNTILRPAIILGSRDNTNRLSKYISNDKNFILVPDIPDMPFQYIDVIDVANFIKITIENELFGEFNVTGKSMSSRNFFEQLAKIHNKELIYTSYYDPKFFPLHEDVENSSLRSLSAIFAINNGLDYTPIELTLSSY